MKPHHFCSNFSTDDPSPPTRRSPEINTRIIKQTTQIHPHTHAHTHNFPPQALHLPLRPAETMLSSSSRRFLVNSKPLLLRSSPMFASSSSSNSNNIMLAAARRSISTGQPKKGRCDDWRLFSPSVSVSLYVCLLSPCPLRACFVGLRLGGNWLSLFEAQHTHQEQQQR